MSDWRDTFERFHGICNQEETRRMGNPDSELAEALENAKETLRGENRMSHDSIRILIDRAIAASPGPADRIGAKLDADLAEFQVRKVGFEDCAEGCTDEHAPTPWTPNTGQVRAAYVRAMRNAFIASAGEHEQEFDRWLESIRVDAINLTRAVDKR